MERAERIGLGVAVVGHVVLLILLSLSLSLAKIPRTQLSDPMDVQFVDKVGLTSAAPKVSQEAKEISADEMPAVTTIIATSRGSSATKRTSMVITRATPLVTKKPIASALARWARVLSSSAIARAIGGHSQPPNPVRFASNNTAHTTHMIVKSIEPRIGKSAIDMTMNRKAEAKKRLARRRLIHSARATSDCDMAYSL